MELAEEVGAAARRHSKKGKTVQITIKYSNFQVITRQTTVPPTYLTKRIFSAGFGLLSRHWDKTRKIRLLGISISGFQDEFEAEQLSLFEDAASYVTSDREEKLERTIDMIRQKHGDSVIRRGP
jgi:DNA polymerase-4